ncbi:Cobalamin-independent methionine synthase [Penicillium sp. DV-2018c]|nr:Cobalamin-independent methionine synthase [Penicillium sp. DV-2018c]KAJ5567249.1 Cobalamin-independent methionine synthase [Penicillium sp. DV-2018c]
MGSMVSYLQITPVEYEKLIEKEVQHVVKTQKDIGLGVFVHGEPERNNMVQYFVRCFDLREGLPLRAGASRDAYIKRAVDSCKLNTAGIRDGTQIRSYFCYSEYQL